MEKLFRPGDRVESVSVSLAGFREIRTGEVVSHVGPKMVAVTWDKNTVGAVEVCKKDTLRLVWGVDW